MKHRRFGTWIAQVVLAAVVMCTIGMGGVSYAAPTATTSYYMTDMTGTDQTDLDAWQVKGCSDGEAGVTGLVVLDFFGQKNDTAKGWGTTNLNRVFTKRSDIAAAVRGYIQGFWNCTPLSQTLKVAIGTNNSLTVSTTAGQQWAYMVNDVFTWADTAGYTSQISVWGANDIEMDFGQPTPAKNWADGYDQIASVPYLNYGDAAGCPQSGSGQGINGNCNNTWKQYDVWYVSWGNASAYPLPEIYTTNRSQAKQWQQISLYGYHNQNGNKLVFQGAMTQQGACQQKGSGVCSGTDNPPATGWQQLYDAINCTNPAASPCNTTQSSLTYSTDIKYAKYPY